ncbi:MAG: response regulator transcription factor [Lachnospiraceae bacterium]|nr:response regulator transcription factor [Lachnospiraceae bacterium]
MRIAVCDDDKNFLIEMVRLLEKAEPGLDTTVVCYSEGEKLLEDCQDKKICYDVVFMDIELVGMDGITLGKKLKETDEEMLLIFLTNYADYAVRGYEAKAFRYMLKPVKETVIKSILAEVKQERGRRQVLQIPGDGEELLVSLQQILFLEAQEKYTAIYVKGQRYLTRVSLNEYEQQLQSKGFFRIHRKYLVNLCNIRKWSASRIEVAGHSLPISRRKEKEFRERFYGYLERGIQE